ASTSALCRSSIDYSAPLKFKEIYRHHRTFQNPIDVRHGIVFILDEQEVMLKRFLYFTFAFMHCPIGKSDACLCMHQRLDLPPILARQSLFIRMDKIFWLHGFSP